MVSSPLNEVTIGKGRSKHIALVMDLGVIGSNRTLHIATKDQQALCRKSAVLLIEEGVDARATSVKSRPVCEKCRAVLGEVKGPWKYDDEQGDT